jgi:hypothetical protein
MPGGFAIASSTSLPSGLNLQLVAGLQMDFASLYESHEQDAGAEGDKSSFASSDGAIDAVVGDLGNQWRGPQENYLLLAASANHAFGIAVYHVNGVIETQQHGTSAKEATSRSCDESTRINPPGAIDRSKLAATWHL